jgi:hypothetical protein
MIREYVAANDRRFVLTAPGFVKPRIRVIVRNGYTDFFMPKKFLNGDEYLTQIGRHWHAWWAEPWPYKGCLT